MEIRDPGAPREPANNPKQLFRIVWRRRWSFTVTTGKEGIAVIEPATDQGIGEHYSSFQAKIASDLAEMSALIIWKS